MPAILITFNDPAQLAAIKASAKRAGMTDRGWARQILLSAAGLGQSLTVTPNGEEADAIAALVGIGMDEAIAGARVAAASRKYPELNADQLVAQAFQENKT